VKFIALACEALTRSVYSLAAKTPHTVSVHLFNQGLHNRPKNLRTVLQEQIDAISPGACDAILLVYGMCGLSTVGLASIHTQLVIPRAHDCITLYLGSRERYKEEFERHPGTYWYSTDYMERAEAGTSVALGAAGIEETEAQFEKYVEKYGREKAEILVEELRKWSQHYTRAVFIDTGQGDSQLYADMAKAKAEQEGWVYERKSGDRRLLEMLLSGQWPEEDFLVVAPGYKIVQSYGDDIVRSLPVNPDD
jgi:Protein of unknown function (DUF1638)